MATTTRSANTTGIKQPRHSLTDITYYTRTFIILGLVLLIVFLLLKIGFDSFNNYLASQSCLQPQRIDRKFGALPPLNFDQSIGTPRPTSYALALPGGGRTIDQLPQLAPQDTTRRVYQITSPVPTLAADQRVRSIARTFGFRTDPELIDNENYRWQSGSDLFEINKQTLAFKYQTNYLTDRELLNRPGKTLPTNSQSVELVKGILNQVNLLPADAATSSAVTTYVQATGYQLTPAQVVSEADFMQVALKRIPLTQETTDANCQATTVRYNYYQPVGIAGPITAIVARNWLDQDSVVSLDYHYQNIDYENYGVYPVRSLESAWQALVNGDAYIYNPGNDLDQAVITGIEVGYFEDDQNQAYLQPIYVFTGQGGFEAYVSAVAPSEIDQNWALTHAQSTTTLSNTPGLTTTPASTSSASRSSQLSTPAATQP